MNRLLKIIFIFTPLWLLAECDSGPLLSRPVASHIKWASETHGLKFAFQGASMPNGPIQSLSIGFHIRKKITIVEARELFILLTQDLIHRINSDKHLRIWLFHYPFTCKNVTYGISFQEQQGESLVVPFITTVFMGRGEIVYQAWDADRKGEIEILREDYVEGQKKCK